MRDVPISARKRAKTSLMIPIRALIHPKNIGMHERSDARFSEKYRNVERSDRNHERSALKNTRKFRNFPDLFRKLGKIFRVHERPIRAISPSRA
jgi:hypothetical protein